MSTLTERDSRQQVKFRRAYRPTSALAVSVRFDDDLMHVSLTDGRIISVPIVWFPLLLAATPEQQANSGFPGVAVFW